MTQPSTRRRPQGPTGSTRRSAGFTLIELMIAVAVIGILASIAIPSYRGYVERARVTDGQALLLSLSSRLERCYTETGSYLGCFDVEEGTPLLSDEGFFRVVSSDYDVAASTFSITARVNDNVLSSGQVACERLTLNHQGIRDSDNDCW